MPNLSNHKSSNGKRTFMHRVALEKSLYKKECQVLPTFNGTSPLLFHCSYCIYLSRWVSTPLRTHLIVNPTNQLHDTLKLAFIEHQRLIIANVHLPRFESWLWNKIRASGMNCIFILCQMVYLFLNKSPPIIISIASKSMVPIDGTINLLRCSRYVGFMISWRVESFT